MASIIALDRRISRAAEQGRGITLKPAELDLPLAIGALELICVRKSDYGDQLEMQMGHRSLNVTTQIYAPDNPDYLIDCLAGIEAIIDEIESLAPGAFTGVAPEVRGSTLPCPGTFPAKPAV